MVFGVLVEGSEGDSEGDGREVAMWERFGRDLGREIKEGERRGFCWSRL